MAVLLVLASGTAVSLAVTDDATTDVGTNANAALQETTTTQDGEQNASITFNEQASSGERVVIESVTMPEGGFIAIHDASVADAPLASVLGNSVYLEPGTHENVTITLARPITESQPLFAMPHLDTNDNQVYDFVLSTGELDGPYTTNGEVLIDEAQVSVAQETTTTTEAVEETTTTTEEAVEETTTTEEEVVEETTTTEEEVVEETTTTEEVVEETTTTEEVVEETTTEEVVEETTTEEVVEETTTTEEEVVEETTTEEVVEETTTTEEVVEETTTTEEEPAEETTTPEEPVEQQQFVFKIEQLNIDQWSFVVGDEEEPDRTEVISDVTVQDRRVTINLTQLLRQSAQMDQGEMPTTMSPEQVEENLTGDLETVRFVIRDVAIENVTFVVTAPADMELPQQPPMVEETTTTEEEVETTEEVEETTVEPVETTTEEVVEETTTTEETGDGVEETTTEEVVETTTEEEVVEETTTTEEEVVEETTTEEEVVEETTTTEEVVEETTTEEEVVEETTTTEEVVEETTTPETTTEEAELNSFDVAELDAPDNATAGDTISVSAVVTNPNDQEATQEVAFRLEGTVIARNSVTLDANEQTTVTFEVDTENVPPGQYIHGIYTRDFGDVGIIVLEEPTEETTTVAETETPDEETTTEEVVETTTEA